MVAIGNAPTALFRLLELLDEDAPRPALVLAFPVGFIGAAEAKEALIERRPRCRPTLIPARPARQQWDGGRGRQRPGSGGAMSAPIQPWLNVVGIGDDGLGSLSAAARAVVEAGEILVGGERHLRMVPDHPGERLR